VQASTLWRFLAEKPQGREFQCFLGEMLALPQCELALHRESGGVQVLEGDFWFRPSPRDEALSASGMEAEDQLPDPARLVTAIRHRRPVWATVAFLENA